MLARDRVIAAVLVSVFACVLYRATMLPGLDLGDSASFQTMAGAPIITPRDGYPLYYALSGLFVRVVGGDRAHALNLASVVYGAIACGLIFLVAAELAGSRLAALAAALLFAGSYTFWSQAIIAEVYTLHILLVSLCLFLLLRWAQRPSTARLAGFFAVYAVSFGNHLSMILLAPAFALFLFSTAPRRWRTMLSPPVVALAAVLACAGALPYFWNLSALWRGPEVPPPSVADALQIFWFDVTKSDWRDTMVLQVPGAMMGERLHMYAFDLRQQFGVIAPFIALAGVIHLVRTDINRAGLLLTAYVTTLAFTVGYNVGDSHVFFLPSHLLLALAMAPGLILIGRAIPLRGAVAVAAVALAASRIYGSYPALDRSRDNRPTELLQGLTAGLDDRQALLLTDLNWQVENGLNHFAYVMQPDLLYTRVANVILYAPALIRDNAAIGRTIVATDRARFNLQSAYGPLLAITRDDRIPAARLVDLVRDLPAGTRYVLCLLRPSREFPLDGEDLQAGLRIVTGNRLREMGANDYSVVAGLVGAEPSLARSEQLPFRESVSLEGVAVDVRMESWLAFDTIRRMGFAQVAAARRHVLIVERGVSFVAFDATGTVMRSGYTAGIFAPQPRYLISMK
jgi:hypothetical protein